MAFDNETRNRLKAFVGEARTLLTEEFTRQCQNLYGLNPATGEIDDLDRLKHLDPSSREIAQLLRTTVEHYRASSPTATTADLLDRVVREQAFTVLNRLCALRLAESREIIIECIARGYQSKGFQLYSRVAGGALGDTGQTYKAFLLSIFDELAVDLPVLFYRYSPQGRLFPGEQALLQLLDLINHDDLASLWTEDETIGWIYQYFNSVEERKKMRDESSAPRNSREMAVRNQFFTPRYVVEFLTDNTLGRTWYEMRKTQTAIPDQCRYFVRRPCEVFLDSGERAGALKGVHEGIHAAAQGDFSLLPERGTWDDLQALALVIDGYREAQRLFGKEAADIANPKLEEYSATGAWTGNSAELWICLFFEQRRWRHFGETPTGKDWDAIQALYHALREDLQRDTANLSQEELWRRPVYTLHRDQKDPRDIKILDPAMGSGHFLLYAFDLLETIYREAWEQAITTPSDVTGRTLREDYADEAALRRAVPELILRHNLHGVDIDPRAVQIAGLALWLRAQKAWQAAGVKPTDRPPIRKSNLVVAEPMPGEQDLLDDFLKDLKPALLGHLVRRVFETMKLAGEAGTLLRVEDELQQEIDKARREWQALNRKIQAGDRRGKQEDMFSGPSPEQTELELREAELMEVTSERFWKDTEERVLKLLREYAEKAENGTGARRRLFADDAAKGFAFVDLCRTKFDVVVMNPPFGDASSPSKPYIDDTYGDTKGDVYKAFVECFADRLIEVGHLGIISSRTGFFLAQSSDWRERVLFHQYRPLFLSDFGHGVLDAMVETAAYVLRSLSRVESEAATLEIAKQLHKVTKDSSGRFSIPQFMRGREGIKRHQAESEISRLCIEGYLDEIAEQTHLKYSMTAKASYLGSEELTLAIPEVACFRSVGEKSKDEALLRALTSDQSTMRFVCMPSDFSLIPNRPFAYWVRRRILRLFTDLTNLESEDRNVRVGVQSSDDFRFLRLWWEVATKSIYQSSDGSPIGSNTGPPTTGKDEYTWLFFAKGGEYSHFYSDIHLVVNWSREGREIKNFFHPSSGKLRSRPQNTEYFYRSGLTYTNSTTKRFSIRALPAGVGFSHMGQSVFIEEPDELAAALSVLNSSLFEGLLSLGLGLADAGRKHYEVGLLQNTPWLLEGLNKESVDYLKATAVRGYGLRLRSYLGNETNVLFSHPESGEDTLLEITGLLADLDDYVYETFGIAREEGALLELPLGPRFGKDMVDEEGEEDMEELAETSGSGPDRNTAYCLGVSFGRWDIRFATGEKEPPPLPDPFDPLPVCPPGMLQRPDGLPVEKQEGLPKGYPIDIPWDGILVDDPGHGRDIVARLKRVFEVIWGEAADDWMREAAELLGQKDGDLRPWLRKDFFPFHLKRYSKSRRKAPIYWPLSTPSGAYTLWIYYHRLTDQTLLTAVNDFVEPKIDQVEGDIAKLRQNTGRTKKQEQELAALTDLEHELRDFREELLRIAKFWKPNLNDGVQITAAPLWKLFQHRPWQTVLKDTWKKLEKGDYDWAHLAYSIWPARVREKCKTDKSLAIAHALEAVYVEPPASAKKGKGRKKKVEVEAEIDEEGEE